MERLEELLIGAGYSVEILVKEVSKSAFSADYSLLQDAMHLVDQRLRRRVLGTSGSSAHDLQYYEALAAVQDCGWEVRMLLDNTEPGLEYLIIDREVAFVGSGMWLARQRPNRRVEDRSTVSSLVSHFRQLWHSAANILGEAKLLYHSPSESAAEVHLEIIPENTWREVIHQLAKRPQEIFELSPRQFEELVAALLREQGYDVELTPTSKDGGKDLLVAVPHGLGDFLYLVECKRYRKPVGVRRVRELYGVVEQERATAGILVTTSTFTRDAVEFRRPIGRRLSLLDYQDLVSWLGGRSRFIGGRPPNTGAAPDGWRRR